VVRANAVPVLTFGVAINAEKGVFFTAGGIELKIDSRCKGIDTRDGLQKIEKKKISFDSLMPQQLFDRPKLQSETLRELLAIIRAPKACSEDWKEE
jgi:hypothetical protein